MRASKMDQLGMVCVGLNVLGSWCWQPVRADCRYKEGDVLDCARDTLPRDYPCNYPCDQNGSNLEWCV
ncbi:hypothetical protein NDU88_009126 [Pleurodeles waltl]|uniref:Secreted protein n=1 Tax=Pleurodeles waltl TaxID=8319 RepID=A0AAV7PU95_PLEWA|nr:hypothetical protein NDU88_009126 [Pleurodeles waltl]